MEGVAHTCGSRNQKEVHFSLDYIKKSANRARDEIMGVLVHEVVHCYQYNACGTCPGGLIEGIAGREVDYIMILWPITALWQILFVYMKNLIPLIGSERLARNGMQVMIKLVIFSTGLKIVTEPERYGSSTKAWRIRYTERRSSKILQEDQFPNSGTYIAATLTKRTRKKAPRLPSPGLPFNRMRQFDCLLVIFVTIM